MWPPLPVKQCPQFTYRLPSEFMIGNEADQFQLQKRNAVHTVPQPLKLPSIKPLNIHFVRKANFYFMKKIPTWP